ncbi:hypothetical protein ACFUN7_08125 [Streptomyces sp. NPDC057236]|uniref:hypothetical protein n=1 Tax=Streptomyces sp. NPDC057236 TaxID=3346059 RepID=UPI003633A46F
MTAFSATIGAMIGGHTLSALTSTFASERPPAIPKATPTEKAATSTERSIFLLIVGFVLT